jgi:hypothetical protein
MGIILMADIKTGTEKMHSFNTSLITCSILFYGFREEDLNVKS